MVAMDRFYKKQFQVNVYRQTEKVLHKKCDFNKPIGQQ